MHVSCYCESVNTYNTFLFKTEFFPFQEKIKKSKKKHHRDKSEYNYESGSSSGSSSSSESDSDDEPLPPGVDNQGEPVPAAEPDIYNLDGDKSERENNKEEGITLVVLFLAL